MRGVASLASRPRHRTTSTARRAASVCDAAPAPRAIPIEQRRVFNV